MTDKIHAKYTMDIIPKTYLRKVLDNVTLEPGKILKFILEDLDPSKYILIYEELF